MAEAGLHAVVIVGEGATLTILEHLRSQKFLSKELVPVVPKKHLLCLAWQSDFPEAMTIGFDAKRLFCNFTGLGNHNRTTLSWLLRLYPQYNYHLFTPRITANDDTKPFLHHQKVVTHLPKLLPGGLWRSLAIPALLKKQGVELYHGLSNELPFNIRRFGIKTVVTIMDLIFKVYPDTYRWPDRQIYDLKFSQAARQADAVVAISESTKRDLVKFYSIEEEKITVIYPICSDVFLNEEKDDLPPLAAAPTDYLLYVGSVIRRKNLALLVEAYRHLAQSDRIPVVVVGHGKQYKSEVMKLISRYRLEKYFRWYPNLTDNRLLRQLYQKATALIYPSLYEGFGLPIAEAHFCKTPVITSNVSSLPEAAGPHGLLVDPNDGEQLAHAIGLLLGDAALRKQMAEASHAFAWQQFHPEKLTCQLMDLYLKLLKR